MFSAETTSHEFRLNLTRVFVLRNVFRQLSNVGHASRQMVTNHA